MDRCQAIGALAAGIEAATAVRDWDRLGSAERTLAPQLAELSGHGPWSALERGALARLRTVHELAALACAEQQAALVLSMNAMHANKAGWIAYTLDSETELDETQA